VRLPPPIDLHAHVEVAIDASELLALGVVFAATRSLEEADRATRRDDPQTVWGVGCHPGLARAQESFDAETFAALIERTAFASEVGLDGSSRVPMATQQATLRDVLKVVQRAPRITSLHSYQATEQVLAELEAQPIRGAVLHWWLGNAAQTRRAIELGCYFSINASSARRVDILGLLPLDRVLTETDHPFGDRSGGRTARPGRVETVEEALGRAHALSQAQIRTSLWNNLGRLTASVGCAGLLPRGIRRQLAAL